MNEGSIGQYFAHSLSLLLLFLTFFGKLFFFSTSKKLYVIIIVETSDSITLFVITGQQLKLDSWLQGILYNSFYLIVVTTRLLLLLNNIILIGLPRFKI